MPGFFLADHAVDGAPVGQATEVAVVDEDIDFEFATKVDVTFDILFGEVAVNRPELNSAITAPGYGLV